MTTLRAQVLQVLADLFDEDPPEDETPEMIAKLVHDRLTARGFAVVPVKPTGAMMKMLRRALYSDASDEMRPSGPAALWAVLLNKAVY